MEIKGAIFDMDGTLVDSLFFWEDLWERIGREYLNIENFSAEESVDKVVRAMIFSDAMALVKEHYGIGGELEDFIRFGNDGVESFYREKARPKEGAIELRKSLKAKGVGICLASATELRHIMMALETYGMLEYFDAVLSCAEIGVGKDRPDIYLLAAERLGVENTADLCVFEDSYVALETAKAAGFKTVGIYDKHNFCQDRLEGASDIYIKKGETLEVLLSENVF